MIVLVDTPTEAELVARILAGAAHRLGDRAPASLATATIVTIGGRSPQFATPPVAPPAPDNDSGLVSFTTAAALIGCSTNTIGAMARRGQLAKVGRRITRTSIERLLHE